MKKAKSGTGQGSVNYRVPLRDNVLNWTVIERIGESKTAEWTQVVKKQPKPNRLTNVIKTKQSVPAVRPSRPLPKAVIIKRGELLFADTVKNIRSKVDVNVIGDSISKIRQTRSRDVLIEIIGGSDKAENIRKEVEKSLGPGKSVRSLQQRSLVQLRDLDFVTTKADVVEAVQKEIGTSIDENSVLNIRPTFGDEQSVVVLVPREAALKFVGKGRVRVGLVYSRIREAPNITRCFRCLEDGHNSRHCKGENRSRVCRRCGKLEIASQIARRWRLSKRH